MISLISQVLCGGVLVRRQILFIILNLTWLIGVWAICTLTKSCTILGSNIVLLRIRKGYEICALVGSPGLINS